MMACLPECKMMWSPQPFPVSNGVKQGCVMAPTLISIMFSAMLTDAFCDSDIAIALIYWFDGKLFNLYVKTKVQTDVMHEFLFAYDCPLNASTQSEMQESLDLFSAACKAFAL